MPTTWPQALPFDPAAAGVSPEIEFAIAPRGERAELLFIASEGARAAGWAGRAAIALADQIGQRASLLLFDLTTNGGELDEHVGAESLEGVADIFYFGASLRHVVQKLEHHRFDFVAAGASADEESLLGDPRWGRLLTEARSGHEVLLAYLPAEFPGIDRLTGRIPSFIALSTADDLPHMQSAVPEYATCVAVLTPPRAPEQLKERGVPTQRSDEEYEAIKVPRQAAREVLIANLRSRQRSAMLTPPPELEPMAEEPPRRGEVPRSKEGRAAPQVRTSRTAPPITEPPTAGLRRARPVKSRRLLYIALSLAVLAGLAAAAFLIVQRHREVLAILNPAAPAAPPAALGIAVPLPYSVAVEQHTDLPVALERLEALREEKPRVGFYVAPFLVDSVMSYRILAGPVPDSAAAAGLVQSLMASGHKSFEFASDTRPAPLAFLLGEFERRAEAASRERAAVEQSIPAYVLPVPHEDGRMRYRVYVGAYTAMAEADVLRRQLRALGFPDSLVERIGRKPS